MHEEVASTHAQEDQEDAFGQLLVQLCLQQRRLLRIVIGAPAQTSDAPSEQGARSWCIHVHARARHGFHT